MGSTTHLSRSERCYTCTLRLQSYIERVSAAQGFDKMKSQVIPIDEEEGGGRKEGRKEGEGQRKLLQPPH